MILCRDFIAIASDLIDCAGEMEVSSFDFIDAGDELFVQARARSSSKRKAAIKVQQRYLLKNSREWLTDQSAFWAGELRSGYGL